jgi:hypothetical protein
LDGCNPADTSAVYAISGEQLFVAQPRACLTHRRTPVARVVDVDLRTRRLRVLASIPGTAAYISAAGRFVAVAYWSPSPRSTESRLLIRVLNTASGAVVNHVTPPADARQDQRAANGVQVDGHGDVLVSFGCCERPPGELAFIARPPQRPSGWWWARAGSPLGREPHLGRDPRLSGRRVVFLPASGGQIDLMDPLDGATRVLVTFTGTAQPEGLAFGGDTLAWTQQSSVMNVVRTAHEVSCTFVQLSPIELASVDVRRIRAAPLRVSGAPIPPQYTDEPPCPVR